MHLSWPPASEPRCKTLHLRLTATEYDRLRAEAHERDLKLSTHARIKLIGGSRNPLAGAAS